MRALPLLSQLQRLLADRSARGVIVAVTVLGIISLFLLPLPPLVLDLLLVFNFFFSAVLLLRALFAPSYRELISFPALLLVSTLFRLGLNISSTRLILLHGQEGLRAAGDVIGAFGQFVVGGDFVVGAIVFSIIAIVNFLVITRGAARVAEVAARFSLDALPGRQLAIDAELRASSITQHEAQRKRQSLGEESQFFGAMDGAMRFVQGDAIAALAIVLINAVGGISLGVTRGLDLSSAIGAFGVLAIGDGLVSIIPALLVAAAAAVVATGARESSSRHGSVEFLAEIFSDRRALFLAGLLLVAVGLIPGFPLFAFALPGALISWWAFKQKPSSESHLDGIERNRGAGLIVCRLETAGADASLVDEVLAAYDLRREELRQEYGYPLPPLSVTVAVGKSEPQFEISVLGRLEKRGSLPQGVDFVGLPPTQVRLLGGEVVRAIAHPVDGHASSLVRSGSLKTVACEALSIPLFNLGAYLGLECFGVASRAAGELFGIDAARTLIRALQPHSPDLVSEVFDTRVLTAAEFTSLLRSLIDERVPIRTLYSVLEAVSAYASRARESRNREEWLSELRTFVRLSIAESQIALLTAKSAVLRVFSLAPELEEEFRAASAVWSGSPYRAPLDPEVEKPLRAMLMRAVRPIIDRGALPVVIVTSSDARPALHDFLKHCDYAGSWFCTLTFDELALASRSEKVGVLQV